jgi:hypothetical protein
MAKEVVRKYPERIRRIKGENVAMGQLPEPMYALEYLEEGEREGRDNVGVGVEEKC